MARAAVYSERVHRNLNPFAEARLAMILWGDEYSNQRGGVMDFWDGLTAQRKKYVADLLNQILEAPRAF